jgi:transmembrane sensor
MSIFQRQPRLLTVLRKYLNNTATEEEKKLLESYYGFLERREDILSNLPEEDINELDARMKDYIIARTNGQKTSRIKVLWSLPRAAAMILVLFLAGGASYFLFKGSDHKTNTATQPAHDVAPGGDRALLTLADGSTILLDSAAHGMIASQNNVNINKTEEGYISYQDMGTGGELQYNTVSTPAGGQYKVQLPDGSLVWLNAASSIRFPTRFSSAERTIYVTGQVYCDIQKDPERPFRLHVEGKQLIEVLGTSFGLNAYTDEASIKTTLVEGSLRVISAKDKTQQITLQPGQRSSLSSGPSIQLEEHVDVYQDIAWKNGLFHFEDTELTTVMRQLSRWYDIGVVYEGSPPSTRFTGKIYRNITASQALDILSFTGVHFKIEGPSKEFSKSRIIVTQ